MITEIVIFLLITILTYYLYVYKKIHWHYDRCGVKYLPGWPIFGNIIKNTFMKRHIIEEIDEVYRAFPDERYVGFIETTTPTLIIRDPDIMKAITVKDFDHFGNRKDLFAGENDNGLFGSSLEMLKVDRWRDMRTTLSPAFTGSKMRTMMPLMIEISKNVVEYLKDKTSKDFLVDDLIHRYANDVIASVGFGLEVNSLVDKENQFYMIGQTLFDFTLWQRCRFFLAAMFPSLKETFKLEVFPRKTRKFFRDLVSNIITYRVQNNVKRPDMIQLLMESAKEWKENELASQVFQFFSSGFEGTAATLILGIHELALNPDVEEKLYQEVKKFKESNGELKYENLAELNYLDCVFNEMNRKWSVGLFMDRVCTKTYVLPPPTQGGKPYTIKPGDGVYNVLNSIHMDPKYHANPEKFDPNRFSDENKHNIKPCTFIPFGMGPRNCIGARFATMELKVLLYYLTLNYKIVKCEKTSVPIKLMTRDISADREE
ncbi:hypothetical protein K1T71_007483 [Dendrolimus kikuchii]|uniref:Uncharacterized protein n=1 Tax=Dendrolimus kikuchii TaxID=765133 RepID=A0ACC1D169_9NEOP|nr:hypothetical protein K1T71_007483 [Dendrolimus kikuchii]